MTTKELVSELSKRRRREAATRRARRLKACVAVRARRCARFLLPYFASRAVPSWPSPSLTGRVRSIATRQAMCGLADAADAAGARRAVCAGRTRHAVPVEGRSGRARARQVRESRESAHGLAKASTRSIIFRAARARDRERVCDGVYGMRMRWLHCLRSQRCRHTLFKDARTQASLTHQEPHHTPTGVCEWIICLPLH